MDVSFSTPGLAGFEALLLQMSTKTARAAGRKAMRQATNVILVEARRLVVGGHPSLPNRITGLLAKSLVTHDRGITGDTINFSVDVTGQAFYARFVEFGTSHSRAYPFMRPAAENKAGAAVDVLGVVLGTEIENAFALGAQ